MRDGPWNADAAVGPSTPNGFYFEHLRFVKSGDEIRRSIDGRIVALEHQTSASELRIAEICKRREIDAKDFTEDRDARSISTKLGSYGEALGSTLSSKSAIEKLQADMNQLRTETWGILGARITIGSLVRVKKNIDSAQRFELNYAELETLGF